LRVYSKRDKAVDEFTRMLRVSSGTKTSIVSLSYRCSDPELARKVLASLLRLASEEHMRIHRTKGSQEFFVKQSSLLEGHLAQLEDQLRTLKNNTGISSLAAQREIKLQLIGSLDADLIRARGEENGIRAELACRQQQLQDAPEMSVAEETTGQPQATDQSLRQRLYDLEVREQELAAQYALNHPLRVELRKQIDGVRHLHRAAVIPVQVKRGINPAHQTAQLAVDEREAQLTAVSARAQSLDTKIASLHQEMHLLNDTEITINRLEREIDLSRTNWRNYAGNLEEARINQQLEEAKVSSLNVMQPPTFSDTPISPKPIPTLAFGLVASAMASIGVALVAYRRQQSRAVQPGTATPPENGASSPESLAAAFSWRSEVAPVKP
jgi:polysaccharide biosynthesis protein PslE